ncbi:hypothetical protein D4758_22470 [Enterocloster citroniae]|nr:hypothetical protein [Enterocloster citroniae]RGC13560.1 hypothetical protein DWZ14_05065 [Enterocloster citroniae]
MIENRLTGQRRRFALKRESASFCGGRLPPYNFMNKFAVLHKTGYNPLEMRYYTVMIPRTV